MAGTMHLSPRDAIVHAFAEVDNDWNGNVESPSGAFARVTITEAQREEMVKEGAPDIGAEAIGEYVVIEDGFGFVHVIAHKSAHGADMHFEQLAKMYEEWSA